MTARRLARTLTLGVTVALAAVVSTACGASSAGGASTSASQGATASGAAAPEVKLGYFPNFTHAPALVGLHDGLFAKSLGAGTKLTPTAFNAGPAELEALLSGAIDIGFIGPNPTINGFVKSNGDALRVIAGAASGGVSFVVKPDINGPQDLTGKKIGTPQLGNTQDVAARYWLKQKGLSTDVKGGGDVSIQPQDNAQILTQFQSGGLDGAWVPEPWATRLVNEGGGKVLVHEADLWPDKKFVITNVIVRTEFLQKYPSTVQKFLEGEYAALQQISKDPTAAQKSANAQIAKDTGKPIKDDLLMAAWKNVEFTADPLPATLAESAKHAEAVGLLPKANLKGLYELKELNAVLTANGQPAVKAPQ